MEAKWIAIALIGVFTAMFGSVAISEYAKYQALGQCRSAAITAGRTPADIKELCKE